MIRMIRSSSTIIMKSVLLQLLISFSFVYMAIGHASLAVNNFCAEITGGEANQAVGHFAVQLYQGRAAYSFSLDLSNFAIKSCNLTNGLLYHIHTAWVNTSTTSSAGSNYCGAAYTGGHYDPNLACGYSSGLCSSLNRTSAVAYDCNHVNYDAGLYALCQVGDLSGKFGTIFGSNSIFKQSSVIYDEQPPYLSNYLSSNKLSTMWSSIVFHCSDNARLVCAKFKLIPIGQSSACSFPTVSDDAQLEREIHDLTSDGFYKTIGLLALSLIGFVLLASVLGWYKLCYKKRKGQALSSQVDTNNI